MKLPLASILNIAGKTEIIIVLWRVNWIIIISLFQPVKYNQRIFNMIRYFLHDNASGYVVWKCVFSELSAFPDNLSDFRNSCSPMFAVQFHVILTFLKKNTDHFVSAICMETLIYSPNFSSGLRTTNRPTQLNRFFNMCIGMNQINLIITFWWSQYMFNRPLWEYIDLWRKQTFHSSLEIKLEVSNIKSL